MGNGKQIITKEIRDAVLDRDSYTCRYCGGKDGPFHCDHVYPESKGGETTVNNLVTACEKCNCKKGSKTGIFPMPIGYFEPKPNRPNLNIVLYWGITNLIIAFIGAANGGGGMTLIFFWVGAFQSAIGLYMVFKNIRFDEAFEVSDDEAE